MIKTDKYPDISAESWPICTKPSEQGLFFQSWTKWVQGVLCYDQNWWKLKYLSRISINMHWQFFFWVFQLFCKSFHTEMGSKVTHNGKFCQKSGLDWLQIANFGHFAGFSIFLPQNEAQIDLGMANFTWFTTFPIFCHQSVSFLEKSQKSFIPSGGVHQQIFWVFQLFKTISHQRLTQNDPQWQILSPKWFGLAQNGQFWSFCRFFHLFPQNEAQIDSEWPISPDGHLDRSFATKASHSWRNLKGLHSMGSGTWANVFSFSTFSNDFTPEAAQNDL